jgi:RND superfamily putative drug exporter
VARARVDDRLPNVIPVGPAYLVPHVGEKGNEYMAALARWCFRHRFLVLAFWLLAAVGVTLLSRSSPTAYSNGFTLPGSESGRAQELLAGSGLAGQGGDDTIVVRTDDSRVTDPGPRAAVTGMLATVAKLPLVTAVRSPYTAAGAAQISADQHTAIVGLSFTEDNQRLTAAQVQPVVDAAATLRSPTLHVEFGGTGFQSLKGRPASGSTAIGLIAAAIVLLVAFGSLLSMAIPLISAVLALGAAVGTIGLLSHAVSIDAIAPTIAALIGLGVGIDYALFIVTRHRNGLRAGLSPEESAVRAVRTAGRAVLFAGGTVTIAMLGLFLLRITFLTGIGIAAAVMVLAAVIAAVTLLPAAFGIVGNRALSRRERRRLGERSRTGAGPGSGAGGFWARWAGFVQRRPVLLGAAATAGMLILVIPAFSIRLGSSDQGNDPASSTTRRAYDLVAEGFGPGYNGPLQLVAQAATAADRDALRRLAATLRGTPGVTSVTAPQPAPPGGAVEAIRVVPATSPQSRQTADLIDHLRSSVIPAAEAGTTLRVYVGGQTAVFADFGTVLSDHLPLFITVVILLGGLLLMVAFRSIVIPLTAAAMNLLAAGASFGVVVAVFQWGWGSDALGLGRPGPIESFLPVMLLAILFGLSMDYQVFLVSRIHEEWVETGDNHRAVRTGQIATGRVITAAAAIMICVFLAFVFGGRRPIGEFGLGLATAILLDALVLRTILVPAAMHLFGAANWHIPTRLDRALPHLTVDIRQPATPRAATLATDGGQP